ncbi:hypothetical protein F8388_023547 [Cannabis sativa]|uniref:Uncharacterized protein n=1 Tax=Cannabis sativa TaxID=3483 RepID=A0A7J6EFY5_CANSA|nr:hypothetical protein F8388_023547 [Cannabis sativa]
MVESAKESIKLKATNSEIYGKMQGVFVEMDRNPVNSVVQELEDLKEPVMKGKSESENRKDTFDPEKHIDAHLPVRVNKQRLSNLLHVLERVHASFVELVPHKYIATFTLFQVVYFTCVFWCDMDSNSWNTIPIAILSSHQLNTIVLPKFFGSTYLRELDAAEYEEIIAAPRSFSLSFRWSNVGQNEIKMQNNLKKRGGVEEEDGVLEMCDGEILDEGEIKVRAMSFTEDRRGQIHPGDTVEGIMSRRTTNEIEELN